MEAGADLGLGGGEDLSECVINTTALNSDKQLSDYTNTVFHGRQKKPY